MKKIILLVLTIFCMPVFSLEAGDLYDSADGYLPCQPLVRSNFRTGQGNIVGPTLEALPTYDQSTVAWPRGIETTWNDYHLCEYINNSIDFVLNTLLQLAPAPVVGEGDFWLEPVGIASFDTSTDGTFASKGAEVTINGEEFHKIVLKFRNPNNNSYYYVTVLAKEGGP